jgi:hypothetical protein
MGRPDNLVGVLISSSKHFKADPEEGKKRISAAYIVSPEEPNG